MPRCSDTNVEVGTLLIFHVTHLAIFTYTVAAILDFDLTVQFLKKSLSYASM